MQGGNAFPVFGRIVPLPVPVSKPKDIHVLYFEPQAYVLKRLCSVLVLYERLAD